MPGPIEYACDHCQKTLVIPSALIGKCVRCKFCKGLIEIPAADEVITGRTIEVSAALVTPIIVPTPEPVKKKRKKRELLDHRGGLIFSFGIISLCLSCIVSVLQFIFSFGLIPLVILLFFNFCWLFGFGFMAFLMARWDIARINDGEMDSNGEISTHIGRYSGFASFGIYFLAGTILINIDPFSLQLGQILSFVSLGLYLLVAVVIIFIDPNGRKHSKIWPFLGLAAIGVVFIAGGGTIFKDILKAKREARESEREIAVNNDSGGEDNSKNNIGLTQTKAKSSIPFNDNRAKAHVIGFQLHYNLYYDRNDWKPTEKPSTKKGERKFDLLLTHQKLDAAFVVLIEEEEFEFEAILNARKTIMKGEGFTILNEYNSPLRNRKGFSISLKRDELRLFTMEFPGKKSSIEFRVAAEETVYPQAKKDFDKIMESVYLDN